MSVKEQLLGSDLSKMMLFMFLGLVVAILVLGFHKSPQASPALGAKDRAEAAGTLGVRVSTNPIVPVSRNPYDSRMY